jgi:hypothetical protein
MAHRISWTVAVAGMVGALLLLLAARPSHDGGSMGPRPRPDREQGPTTSGAPAPAERLELTATEPAAVTGVRLRMRLLHEDGRPFAFIPVTLADQPLTHEASITAKSDGRCELACDWSPGTAVQLAALGWTPITVRIGPAEAGIVDLGDLTFQARGTLRVEISHAPERPSPWLELGVFTSMLVERGVWGGGDLRFGQQTLATPDGSASATFAVPSHYPLRANLAGDSQGASVLRTDTSIPELAPGEERTLVLDLGKLATVSGRLAHIPGEAGARRCLLLQEFGDFAESQNAAREHWTLATDEKGCFQYCGVRPGSWIRLQLHLMTGDVVLRTADGHDTWRAGETVDLEVEPAARIVGVGLQDAGGIRLEKQPFAVSTDPKFVLPAAEHPGGLELVNAAALAAAPRLWVLLDENTIVQRSAAALATTTGSLILVTVPPSDAGCGSIVVETADDQSELGVDVRETGGALLAAHRTERRPRETRVDLLAPGRYDVGWIGPQWRWQEPIATAVEVRAGETTHLRAEIPHRRRVDGVITNWATIPEPLRPTWMSLQHASAHIAAGQFKVIVDVDKECTAEFALRPTQLRGSMTAPVAYSAERDQIQVSFPFAGLELRPLTVAPKFGGRPLAYFSDARAASLESIGPSLLESFPGENVGYVPRGENEGPIPLLFEGRSLFGVVWEGLATQRIFRGWFRIDPDATLGEPFGGRTIELRWSGERRFVEVLAQGRPLGDWTPHPVKIAATITAQPLSVFVPDQTAALIIRSADRPDRSFPLVLGQTSVDVGGP